MTMKLAEKRAALAAMGIDVWLDREQPAPATMTTESNTMTDTIAVAEPPVTAATSALPQDWDELVHCVADCKKCPLYQSRTQTVFGVGNRQADLLVVGEAPGANEDAQGEPFVGRGGKLLDSMLQSIGLERSNIFIANVLKCRPPNNRDPAPDEVAQCTPYLQAQINLLQPKMIVAVGRIAAHFLLQTKAPLGKLRGREFHYGDLRTPLIVSYHPAYLLRSPGEKRKAYEDLLRVKAKLQEVTA